MARLSKEQWGKLKAKWVTGKYADSKLGRDFGVSHTAIQKRAKKEGWERLDANVVEEAVVSRAKLKTEVSRVAKVSKIETNELEEEIDRLATLRTKLEGNAIDIAKRVPDFLKTAGGPQDLKALAETNSKLYETHFKQSGTQVNVQNNSIANAAAAATTIDPSKLSKSAMKELLEARRATD
jgi:hypothetical protein